MQDTHAFQKVFEEGFPVAKVTETVDTGVETQSTCDCIQERFKGNFCFRCKGGGHRAQSIPEVKTWRQRLWKQFPRRGGGNQFHS